MNDHQPLAMPLVLQPRNPPRSAFRKIAVIALFLLMTAGADLPIQAQEVPRVQVFGGYSYTRFDTPSFGFTNSTGINGYNFSAAFNIIRGFGVKGELSGQYTSQLNLRDVAVGPQFLYPRGKALFFGHLLFGRARSLVHIANGQEDTDRAVALGGGMDWDLTDRFAVRVFQVDYLHTNLFSTTQNNIRFSTGLVYHWGSIGRKGRRAPATSP
jgi:Outer membrane protein beta-barrel domain